MTELPQTRVARLLREAMKRIYPVLADGYTGPVTLHCEDGEVRFAEWKRKERIEK